MQNKYFRLKRRFTKYDEYELKREPEITILAFYEPERLVFIPETFNFTMEEWDEMEAIQQSETT